MIKKLLIINVFLITSSCSYISGPEGYFPTTKYDFLKEEVEKNITLPESLELAQSENHYPVIDSLETMQNQDVPKPRQIFASSGNSSVQLRRLGELMWIYIETLPSTSWPISKNYWDTSSYQVISANPKTGEIEVDFDESSFLKMKIEHGIKEASTEIFLYKINKDSNEIISNPNFIQAELENVVNYFADSISSFSGTSLAAQNLNEMKKAKIFAEDGQTVIELDLSFDRAWSSISKAMTEANITSNDITSNDITSNNVVDINNSVILNYHSNTIIMILDHRQHPHRLFFPTWHPMDIWGPRHHHYEAGR